MRTPLPQASPLLEAAWEAVRTGRPADGVRILEVVLRSAPRSAPALHILGLCRAQIGDLQGAEKALRASLASDKRRPAVHAALGQVLAQAGRSAEAEKAYRAGLGLDRFHLSSTIGLSEILLSTGRLADTLQVTAPLAAAAEPPAPVLELRAEALKRLGRTEEALAVARRAVVAGSSHATLDVAINARELGLYEEAEAAAREAIAGIGEHPAAMAVLGQTLLDLDRDDEAEAVYRAGLVKAPADANLHLALVKLLWARTGDAREAARTLDAALGRHDATPLLGIRAKLHVRQGAPADAFSLLAGAAERAPDDAVLQAMAATAAIEAGHVALGLAHAERAAQLAPHLRQMRSLLTEALLAAGQPERAGAIIAELVAAEPEDQHCLALQATAWRMLGDARYGELYDYDALVGVFTLPTPKGWPSLSAYLGDLAKSLEGRHTARRDPFDQSLRSGTQTAQNLVLSTDPAIKALFPALGGPVADYLARLGKGEDAFRRRNTLKHRFRSAWSVRLGTGGFHLDHIHPGGWISSAFYVDLPREMEDGTDRRGWIKFGQPGVPTDPPLKAEHFVRPERGRLMLFPSYMWHGTVPFEAEDARLTMAFDILPG